MVARPSSLAWQLFAVGMIALKSDVQRRTVADDIVVRDRSDEHYCYWSNLNRCAADMFRHRYQYYCRPHWWPSQFSQKSLPPRTAWTISWKWPNSCTANTSIWSCCSVDDDGICCCCVDWQPCHWVSVRQYRLSFARVQWNETFFYFFFLFCFVCSLDFVWFLFSLFDALCVLLFVRFQSCVWDSLLFQFKKRQRKMCWSFGYFWNNFFFSSHFIVSLQFHTVQSESQFVISFVITCRFANKIIINTHKHTFKKFRSPDTRQFFYPFRLIFQLKTFVRMRIVTLVWDRTLSTKINVQLATSVSTCRDDSISTNDRSRTSNSGR